MISYIVAMDKNRVIGKNNKLPWHLPNDLRHFKETTMGHPIVMGRKTYESIGKPLPGRENIVLTTNKDLEFPGCTVLHSKEELLNYLKSKDEEVFVIGGSALFDMFIDVVDNIYLTLLHHEFDGDTYFPEIDLDAFNEVWRKKGPKNEKNPYDYEYILFQRK